MLGRDDEHRSCPNARHRQEGKVIIDPECLHYARLKVEDGSGLELF